MDCIYSKNDKSREQEIGRIESVKHVEWLLIPIFLFFGLTHQSLDFAIFIIFCLGAQFPDIIEGLFFKFNMDPNLRRLISHSFLIPLILLLFSVNFSSIMFYFFLSYFGHLIIDLFAGGDPVYLLGPFSRKYKFQIIRKEMRLKIGDYVHQRLGYLWEEQTNGDLAWFWILQFFGSVFCGLAFIYYVFSIS